MLIKSLFNTTKSKILIACSLKHFSNQNKKSNLTPNQKLYLERFRRKFYYNADMNPSQNKVNIEDLSEHDVQKLFNQDIDLQKSKEELLKQLKIDENAEINLITEGKAKIFVKTYKATNLNQLEEQEVFYNPVQTFNRDLTVFIIKSFAEKMQYDQGEKFQGIRVLDALAATGLRTIRFSKEIKTELIKSLHANDISEYAMEMMKKNFEINKVDQSKIFVTQEDANGLMYKSRDSSWSKNSAPQYDVIDLDPYGSSIPYLDTAIQAVRDGGLICCTCTDSKMLCGPEIAKCFYTYSVSRSKMEFQQENALRIVLSAINSIANKYSKSIKPVFSYLSEFYVRIFFTVHSSKLECAKSITRYGNVYHCPSCDNHHIHSLGKAEISQNNIRFLSNKINLDLSHCDQCNDKYVLNGPVWIDELNDISFVRYLYEQLRSSQFDLDLQTKKRIFGMIHSILDEQETRKYPYGVSFARLGRFFKTSYPDIETIKKVTEDHGYTLRASYIYPDQWKTNAPNDFFFEMIKAYKIAEKNKRSEDIFMNLKPGSAPYIALQKPLKYNFEFHIKKTAKEPKIPRFFPNPEKNWGPKKMATRSRMLVKSDANEENQSNTSVNNQILNKKKD